MRLNSRRLQGCASVLIAASVITTPAVHAQTEKRETRSDPGRAKAVRPSAQQISALRLRALALAAAIRDREAILGRLERDIREAQRKEKTLAAGYEVRQAQLARVLAILQRIQVHPPFLLALDNTDANTAVRAAIVIRRLTPHLQQQVETFSRWKRSLATLRKELRRNRRDALAARRQLETERQEIRLVLRRQERLLRPTGAERAALRAEINDLRRRARTVHQLLTRLEIRRRKGAKNTGREAATRPETLRDFRKGVAILPASGTIIRRFGDPDKQGDRSKGIVIRALRRASVVAPWDGQVQFAGRFRNLGRILIIRHDGGYHSVLLGLNRIDVVAKQWVLAGEPVGVVGEFRASGPELYYEVRRSGRPVDPLPWLAANQRNAR